MPSKNKARGNAAEAYVVKQFQKAGFSAKRGWGSDGRAMGEHQEVDVKVEHRVPQLLQVKRRVALASYIKPSEHVHAQILYQDGRGSNKREVYAVVPLERFIDLLIAEKDLMSMVSEMQYDEEAASY